MAQGERIFVGLDIGTTKISCIVADMNASGEPRVVGIGNAPSEGLRRGVVVDLEKTVHSIQRAVAEAERMAGIPVRGVHAGIAGDHIRSINSRGVIAVSRKDNEIGVADVERVVEAAKAVAIKIQHGCAVASLVGSGETIAVSGVGGRTDREISRHVLASMIEPRMEEIFSLANKEVRKNHFAELLGGGVVLTGGTSLMPGLTELAERVFEMPVRLGVPQGLGGLAANIADPRFSTGVGLVLHAAHG